MGLLEVRADRVAETGVIPHGLDQADQRHVTLAVQRDRLGVDGRREIAAETAQAIETGLADQLQRDREAFSRVRPRREDVATRDGPRESSFGGVTASP
ncbi:hypothetical protein AB0K15_39385 [Amycolatopsis sp. NPDC049253]|uniref:hypothetical protein n=1 Tax=Amycolatopsis sp. NPDC049253 TaxID=3155274 RepID=UPI003419FF65